MQPTASIVDNASPFVLLSPLPNWSGAEKTIGEGIDLRRLLPVERAALELSDTLLQHHDVGSTARDAYWLCYEFENNYPRDNVRYRRRQEAAFKLMLHAVYSVQILLPIGARSLFLLYRKTNDGLNLDSIQHRQPLIETVWSRLSNVPVSFGEEVPILLDRVHEVFQKPTLRLQIPIWLLEQGLGAPDRHIRILLLATGLDGITRSGGIVGFSERLCQLLGGENHIFPAATTLCTPKYKVSDVVEDLYQLRNEMAHGLPFHEKFRKKRGFLAENDQPIAEEFANYRYDQVLEECATFLLCKALREVLLRNLAFDVQTSCWSEQD